jgi:Leucine-rich repeat (LRR) protein
VCRSDADTYFLNFMKLVVWNTYIPYSFAGNIYMGKRRSLKVSALVLPALLLVFFYGAGGAHCSMVHGNMTDRSSLLDFKEAITDDPTGALRDWNDNIHHCKWFGVSCSTRHTGRVTMLDVSCMNLTGQLTPSLGNLTFLWRLMLYLNHFSGQLPPLNHLRKLDSVALDDNLLQGNIQDAFIALANCSKLTSLSLGSNMLVGSIPRNIGFPSNLLDLYLGQNNLTGGIPLALRNITHLEEIELDDNNLEGSIEELGQLPEILYLSLRGNRLSGKVPATLFNLSHLEGLDLSINMLSGHIPDLLGNRSELFELNLSSNHFTGQIPSGLGKLHKLQSLYLDNNKLEARDSESWEFLDALSNCPDLHELTLYGNQLHGVLPNSVGNLSATLYLLDLGANDLCGTVPPSIGALKNLYYLHLGGNNFVGTIPYSIGNLTELTHLDLCDNQFDGW